MDLSSLFPRVAQHAVLIIGAGSITVLLLKSYFKKTLVEKLVRDQVFKVWYDNIEYALSILAAIWVATWKAYDVSLWRDPNQSSLVASGVLGALICAILYGKYLKAHIALGESKKISALESDNRLLTDSRDWLVQTAETIDAIVTEKFKRLAPLLLKPCVQPTEIVSKECVKRQILININQIHEVFSVHLAPASSLRLGVYFRSATVKDSLELGYSWDGDSESCFSQKSSEYLKTVRSGGVMSQLAKCYNSDEGMILVSSCAEGEKNGTFRYLYPGQEQKIKSMLVFRCDFIAPDADPWIIYLDSDQEGFFDASKKADYKIFLGRVTKRISFELVTLGLANKFCPTP